VLPSPGTHFGHLKQRFEYYVTDHPHVREAIDVLLHEGFIFDVTPRDYPVYRMTENFVDLVCALHPIE